MTDGSIVALQSSFLPMMESKSLMLSAFDSVTSMWLNFMPSAGLDDQWRSALAPLPTEIQSFYLSQMDMQNSVVASVLNGQHTEYVLRPLLLEDP